MDNQATSPENTMQEPESHRTYWQAQGLVELNLSKFHAAVSRGKSDQQRSIFYRLARYHGRTLRVLNSGLHRQDEPMVQASLHNLSTLHRGMMQMHRTSPKEIPLPLLLSEHSRHEFVRDIIVRVLDETPPALDLLNIHERAVLLDLLGEVTTDHVDQHLSTLVQDRHAEIHDDGFVRTTRPYVELDKEVAALRALVGRRFFYKFAQAGYDSLRSIDQLSHQFRQDFVELTGFTNPHTAELFLHAVHLVLDTSVGEAGRWRINDLLHSTYPRPYQRAAHAAFRQGAYRSLIADAPTGSGKTLIGMMCIQEWLRTLDMGESILVLVPTSNYQQQWIDELCYNPIGLQLQPELIFSGTPSEFDRYQELTGGHPAILVITYAALSQLGSPKGKGGFDAQSVETFLQQADVRHVILDEVHKVAEDMHGVAADVTRLLVSWEQDTSLNSLIGFSGTAMAYRRRLEALGLTLAYRVPMDDLVAAGFVAPFAEIGVPFAFSARERRIRELLDAYKEAVQRYFELLGPARLRQWFAQLDAEDRRYLGHEVLGMYRGRADWRDALDRRFDEWENGPADSLKLTEARLVTILQIANGWSDRELVHQSAAEVEAFEALLVDIDALKDELVSLVYLPQTIDRLQADDFTRALDAEALRNLPQSAIPVRLRSDAAKDILSTTIAGLYDGLSEWYLRTGEGRVGTIKAVINAERTIRDISGIIIFDSGRHIPWRQGTSMPGYQGLAGLFSEMLGDPQFTVMAVLSNEMYLTYSETDPITQRIGAYIRDELMEGEVADAIFNHLVSGLGLDAEIEVQLRALFEEKVRAFTPELAHMHTSRPASFDRAALRPLRRAVNKLNLGLSGERMLARMDRRNVHLKRLIQLFFDYGLLAAHFREAHVSEVEQVSGARQPFFVVTMPGGPRRKQLMYDLTARIVDAESLPVNLVIVSNWARTGWNVIKPNLLIDATATRDVSAWQQLRGRAIRARRTWNNDCYRLLSVLVGHYLLHEVETEEDGDGTLDDAVLDIMAGVASPQQRNRLMAGGITALSKDERHELAVRLMQGRNKVTHIYELVKATGSTSQVIFDRTDKAWHRREGIAAKHNREVSVNPFSGQKSMDDSHAPFIYAQDPRTAVPDELQQELIRSLDGCDDVIVTGWLGGGAGDDV